MICPNCGTDVPDSTSVCPACHYRLSADTVTEDETKRWCDSCGSPVPPELNACPMCGMPVEGAFDDDEGKPFTVRVKPSETRPESESTMLVSAIPSAPVGPDVVAEVGEQKRHTRLVLLAAFAALLLVGGTTLYIARPWDPDAYRIHATEDADTSMEGFPGERPHLSSQDRAQEEEYQSELQQQKERIEAIHERLGELAKELDSSYEAMNEYLRRGYLLDDGDNVQSALGIASELDSIELELNALDLYEEDLQESRDKLLVLVQYLSEATDVLIDAWSAAGQEDGDTDATFTVRAVLEGNVGEKGYDDWFELFANAYGFSR